MSENENKKVYQVIILGSGPCGLTAALYTARAGLQPLVLHGDVPGGQLTTTSLVENYPGFKKGIDGPELIEVMTEQAKAFGTTFKYENVKSIDSSSRPFKILLEGKEEVLLTETIIVATGARPRKLGIESEEKYWSKGVTSCATCDGYFYRGREVVVIGAGDSAMEEALFLTRFCPKVKIVHRRNEVRASKIMAERATKHEQIEFVWNSVVTEIIGNDEQKGIKVTGVKLKDTNTGEEKVMETGGVFLAIGHIPNTDFLKGVSDLDDQGYAITAPDSTKTKVEGLFVAGDAKDKVYRQAVTAAGSGCMAAIECERYLEALHAEK